MPLLGIAIIQVSYCNGKTMAHIRGGAFKIFHYNIPETYFDMNYVFQLFSLAIFPGFKVLLLPIILLWLQTFLHVSLASLPVSLEP